MTHPHTILLIDDDYMSHYLTRRLLQKYGVTAHILTAANGAEGIRVLDSLSCDLGVGKTDWVLVLLDLNMPVMDGWTFLDQYSVCLGHLPYRVEIFLLSSSINPDDRQKAATYPMVKGFLNKPLPVDRLFAN